MALADFPIHQHMSILNLKFLLLLNLNNLLTFKVLKNVSIGIGAFIHISKAYALVVVWGLTSFICDWINGREGNNFSAIVIQSQFVRWNEQIKITVFASKRHTALRLYARLSGKEDPQRKA